MANAKRLMDAKGCACTETRNKPWMANDGPLNYLYCTINDQTGGFPIAFRRWQIALIESDAGTVADVRVSTGLVGL
jgi:hypothetical protein